MQFDVSDAVVLEGKQKPPLVPNANQLAVWKQQGFIPRTDEVMKRLCSDSMSGGNRCLLVFAS